MTNKFEKGNRVKICWKSQVWSPSMHSTLGMYGTIVNPKTSFGNSVKTIGYALYQIKMGRR